MRLTLKQRHDLAREAREKRRSQISMRISRTHIEFLEREAYLRSAHPPFKEVNMSDVIRLAIDHFRNTSSFVPDDPCTVVTAGDMSMCTLCGLRWDTNDTRPKCPCSGRRQP